MAKYWVTCISKFLVEADSEEEACDLYESEYDNVEVELVEEDE